MLGIKLHYLLKWLCLTLVFSTKKIHFFHDKHLFHEICVAYGIIWHKKYIFLFSSHSCNSKGQPNLNGPTVLLSYCYKRPRIPLLYFFIESFKNTTFSEHIRYVYIKASNAIVCNIFTTLQHQKYCFLVKQFVKGTK